MINLHSSLTSLFLFPLLFSLVACGSPAAPGGPQASAPPALEGSSKPAKGQARAAISSREATHEVDVAQRYAPSQRQARAPSQSELYAVVTADPDPAARRAAIDGLGDDLSASSELLRALGADEEPVVRRWAALALERRANPALASALRQAAISETDLAVRHILERALTRTGG